MLKMILNLCLCCFLICCQVEDGLFFSFFLAKNPLTLYEGKSISLILWNHLELHPPSWHFEDSFWDALLPSILVISLGDKSLSYWLLMQIANVSFSFHSHTVDVGLSHFHSRRKGDRECLECYSTRRVCLRLTQDTAHFFWKKKKNKNSTFPYIISSL